MSMCFRNRASVHICWSLSVPRHEGCRSTVFRFGVSKRSSQSDRLRLHPTPAAEEPGIRPLRPARVAPGEAHERRPIPACPLRTLDTNQKGSQARRIPTRSPWRRPRTTEFGILFLLHRFAHLLVEVASDEIFSFRYFRLKPFASAFHDVVCPCLVFWHFSTLRSKPALNERTIVASGLSTVVKYPQWLDSK